MAPELADWKKNTHNYKWHQSWQTGSNTHNYIWHQSWQTGRKTQLQMAPELADWKKNTVTNGTRACRLEEKHSYKWHQSLQTGRKTHTITNGTRAGRVEEKHSYIWHLSWQTGRKTHTVTYGTWAGRLEEKHTQLQMAPELADWKKNTHSYKWHQSWQSGRKTHTVTNGIRACNQGETHTNIYKMHSVDESLLIVKVQKCNLCRMEKNTVSYVVKVIVNNIWKESVWIMAVLAAEWKEILTQNSFTEICVRQVFYRRSRPSCLYPYTLKMSVGKNSCFNQNIII